jgi:microtubule-associated protein 1
VGPIDISTVEEAGSWMQENVSKLVPNAQARLNPSRSATTGGLVDGFVKFAESVCSFLVHTEVQDLLPGSDVVGAVPFSRPTLYVFAGGNGPCALFGIRGFTLLVDGGYPRRSCFWSLVKHFERIDGLLVTHIGPDNVFGIQSFFEHKFSGSSSGGSVFPLLGPVFLNAGDAIKSDSVAASRGSGLLVNLSGEFASTLEHLRQLNIHPHPCLASGPTIHPVNLFHNISYGSLDMYVVSPAMADSGKLSKSSTIHADHQSVCAVIVFRPSTSNRNHPTRILFGGAASQSAIFEGLDRLKAVTLFQTVSGLERTAEKPVPHKPAEKLQKPLSSKPMTVVAVPSSGDTHLSGLARMDGRETKKTVEVHRKEPAASKPAGDGQLHPSVDATAESGTRDDRKKSAERRKPMDSKDVKRVPSSEPRKPVLAGVGSSKDQQKETKSATITSPTREHRKPQAAVESVHEAKVVAAATGTPRPASTRPTGSAAVKAEAAAKALATAGGKTKKVEETGRRGTTGQKTGEVPSHSSKTSSAKKPVAKQVAGNGFAKVPLPLAVAGSTSDGAKPEPSAPETSVTLEVIGADGGSDVDESVVPELVAVTDAALLAAEVESESGEVLAVVQQDAVSVGDDEVSTAADAVSASKVLPNVGDEQYAAVDDPLCSANHGVVHVTEPNLIFAGESEQAALTGKEESIPANVVEAPFEEDAASSGNTEVQIQSNLGNVMTRGVSEEAEPIEVETDETTTLAGPDTKVGDPQVVEASSSSVFVEPEPSDVTAHDALEQEDVPTAMAEPDFSEHEVAMVAGSEPEAVVENVAEDLAAVGMLQNVEDVVVTPKESAFIEIPDQRVMDEELSNAATDVSSSVHDLKHEDHHSELIERPAAEATIAEPPQPEVDELVEDLPAPAITKEVMLTSAEEKEVDEAEGATEAAAEACTGSGDLREFADMGKTQEPDKCVFVSSADKEEVTSSDFSATRVDVDPEIVGEGSVPNVNSEELQTVAASEQPAEVNRNDDLGGAAVEGNVIDAEIAAVPEPPKTVADGISFDPQLDWDPPQGLPAPLDKDKKSTDKPPSAKQGGFRAPAPKVLKSKAVDDLNSSELAPVSGAAKADAGRRARLSLQPGEMKALASQHHGLKVEAITKKPVQPSAIHRPIVPFYVDLAYLPVAASGGSFDFDREFFQRVRARYYVVSAANADPRILELLADAKPSWEDGGITPHDVSVIPTGDSTAMFAWYSAHREQMAAKGIMLSPSASQCTVELQGSSCTAFRLEF